MAIKTLISPASQMVHYKMTRQLMLSFFLYTTPYRPQMARYDMRYTRYDLHALCAFSWLKNPCNQRNPRLMNYLRAFGISTTVVSALQIHLFMQNEPNFRKSQMNSNNYNTRDYEKKTLGEHGKKQSQTNPNKAKFKKAKMNVTYYITKGYENKPPFRAPKKQSQISKRQKPMQTSLPQRIMKKTALSGPGKTNPKQTQLKPILSQNKPNTNPKRTQSNPIKANIMPKQTQYKPKQTQSNPISNEVRRGYGRLFYIYIGLAD